MKHLSKTYEIDTIKGFFPHHFNTPENQDYEGKVPAAEMFGHDNMGEKERQEFDKWYEQQQNITKLEI